MTRIIGTMRRIDDTRGAVRVEDVYDTDIEDLWVAVTEPQRLARWIAEVDGDLTIGGTIQARFTSTWQGSGRIDVCERPTHLLLTMEPGTEDEAQIEAWLTRDGERTRLVVEERGLPLATLYQHGAGWQAHVMDLRRYLAGQPSQWRDTWNELSAAYQNMPLQSHPALA